MERLVIAALVILMLLTGTVNTISTKYQDIQCVEWNEDGSCKRKFEHFAVQSAMMFTGELLCILPPAVTFLYRQIASIGSPKEDSGEPWSRRLRVLVSFGVPALCDVTGSTLLNVGIFYTYPSVYQMLRGTVVFFAGIFTTMLLGRKLKGYQWISLGLIVFGAAIVGCVSVIHLGKKEHDDGLESNADADATNPLLGNILVTAAQLAAAFQFIVEEKYLSRYQVEANVAVGFEGFWGLAATSFVLLPVMANIKDSTGHALDSFPEAMQQIRNNTPLMWYCVGSILSIAFFNFFGIMVTKKLSGASRATIDACRTIFVWLYSLQVGWEQTSVLKNMIQVVGFVIMVSGTFLFNGIFHSKKKEEEGLAKFPEEEPLLRESKAVYGAGGRKQWYMPVSMARSFRLGRSMLSTPSPSLSNIAGMLNRGRSDPADAGAEEGVDTSHSHSVASSFQQDQDLELDIE